MSKRLARLLALMAIMLATMLAGHSVWAQAEDSVPQGEVAAAEDEVGSEAQPEAATDAKPPILGQKWIDRVDQFFGDYLVTPLYRILFYDFGTEKSLGAAIPFVVAWLFCGAVFLTLRMGFINFRAFWLAIRLTKGDFDDPTDKGEVTHFQALASALSATVGLGNIAGVAIAVCTGGPGAVFWMILAGLLGMTSKFTECALGQMYRTIGPDGRVSGGPMHYLSDGLRDLNWGPVRLVLQPLGLLLALLFTVMCIGASFGGGCAFQVVQSLNALQQQIPVLDDFPWLYGLAMTFFVGLVIIGGIRRIAATAEKIVPAMCGIYVLTCLYIIAVNYSQIIPAVQQIVVEAFSPAAVKGGFIGVLVIGIRRAAFSNEAGVGSAAIAHAAARTDEPVSEGIVALLEPFIDTVVVCTFTGLVIVITGVYDVGQYPAHQGLIQADKGAAITSIAFGNTVSWFPWILAVAVTLFAYSTMISWSYYGERCWVRLFGPRSSLYYKLLFLVFVFLGSIVSAKNILDFSDLMILAMALPNILGLYLLSGKVRRALDAYLEKYRRGELTPGG